VRKYLIIHADDFGLSPGISKGILQAIHHGVVSSTSVIIRSPYIHNTQLLVNKYPDIDWGLHVVIENNKTQTNSTIARETETQLTLFTNYFGFTPSHIDFHKGFRFTNRIYFSIRMLILKYKLAFRYDNCHKIETGFYGYKNRVMSTTDISPNSLINILSLLTPGITELVCHPGYTGNRLYDPYRTQRSIELTTLTSESINNAIRNNGIHIINFKDYRMLTTHTLP
jgi:predicted glycoside hydrolase/deacetylase ChbG (UPF0249 family)